MQMCEGLSEAVVGDLVVIDVDAVEDRLVEHAALLFVAAAVELLGVLQQGERGFDEPGAVGEVLGRGGEAFAEASSLAGDLAELGLDLVLPDGGVGRQFDEVLFAGVQRLQLGGELFVEQSLGRFLLVDGAGDFGADGGDELGAEADRGVVVFHGVFDKGDVDVRCFTAAVLLVAAEEVGVFAASGVDGVLDDQPLGDARSFAASAEQRALEVVGVLAAAFSCRGAGFEEILDAIEQVLVDEWLVPALDLLAIDLYVSEVVAVSQHHGELVDRDLLGGMATGGPGAQAAIVELVGQVFQRVVTGDVELESKLDKGRAFGVDGDGADFAAVEPVSDVEVAQRRAADRAAILGFLLHLVRDVRAGLPRLILVEGGQDAVHELTDRRVVDGLGGRHEGDPALTEIGHDDGVVEPVPRHPGQLVDDDVVDVARVANSREHPLELDSLRHLGRCATRLDVFINDRQAELLGFALAFDALGGYRDTFGVVVVLDLASR
ncbi:hypothetical protein A4R43_24925 [Amycolatopsis albispora]|uniref:NAD-specific glutamate dehydrogenase n=1 Tax=Amycolatopsis albispora TaxID=1804986 RepID=A0A344LBB1_9PSEU|nr:hypothetical protein A4R43_24925 [Amycolatopsis albispora]